MRVITEQILNEMKEAIVRAVAPEQIYLFGSRGRGDANPDSDIDMLIVEREPFGPERSRWEEIARIRNALPSVPTATDILVYSADEVDKWRGSMNHVIAHCLREGRLLYARS